MDARDAPEPAPAMPVAASSELLGHPPDARVLIVNADDLGMNHAINAAVIDSIENGIAGSCSVMVPCPGADHALRLLRERPRIAFGIHLTLVCETAGARWGPRAAAGTVSSLLAPDGTLFTPAQAPLLLARARPDHVEREFRAQIDAVADAGLAPTHLDFHCLADGGRTDILDLAVALADEYGLAVRVWLDPARQRLRSRGRPVVDHPFVDSFSLAPDAKEAEYARLLRGLAPGLSEWAVHPGPADPAHAVDGGRGVRRRDHAFLTSPQARDLLVEEEITVIDYRPLQQAWRRAAGR
ncbi:ChbG/HpnK family deacetylase [Nocardiopsis mangrovi]|uniref:ChbG/HpnK family deacetylase n=1 Tax=Nocardiopsis mangrovi TaxID=1179818 RepID=A0ABV9DUL2_9ACTN